jgi:hypothetical protein
VTTTTAAAGVTVATETAAKSTQVKARRRKGANKRFIWFPLQNGEFAGQTGALAS